MQTNCKFLCEKHNASRHFGVSMQVFLQLETLSEQRRSECRSVYMKPICCRNKINFITIFSNKTPQIAVKKKKINPTLAPLQKAPYLVSHLVKVEGVPCTLFDNRIVQNYLAFSCIVGNSKQGFTLTKSQNSNSHGRKIDLYEESLITEKFNSQSHVTEKV